MQWLTPLTGLFAAAVAIPLLVVLYFLKLRRREMEISSTFLWKRAVQDLQVNAPFQRLRKNLLLFLQLLALCAVLLALAGPVLRLEVGQGQRVVLLIDRSASMTATDAQPDRLSLAKEQARRVVDSLRTAGTFSITGVSDQAMVIAFDSHAKVMCGFTADKDHLRAALEAIAPGDGGSSLAEAVEVGRAYAQPPEEAKNQSAEPAAQLELFSDGRLSDFADVVVRPGELRYHCVASSDDNIGVVAMDARRSYENPREVTVFAVLSNSGHDAVACDVQLTVNHNIRGAQRVAIPAAVPPADGQPGRPSQISVTFTLEQEGESIVEVRQLRRDILAMDDAVWAVLPRPRRLSAALVTAGNLPLQAALEACPLASLKVMTPADFDRASVEQIEALDVVVLDNHIREDLPRGRYLSFGAVPLGIAAPLVKEGEFVIDWQARHPVLEYINLANVYTAEHRRMELPRQAHVLAEFSDGPAIALVRAKGSTLVAVGFELGSSNWPFEPGFVMFCTNATSYLGSDVGASTRRSLRLGEPLAVEAVVGAGEAQLSDPSGKRIPLPADASGGFRLPQTTRVGIYSIKAGERPWERFAVNLLSSEESNISPVPQLNLSGAAVAAETAAPRRQNQEVWPWLAGLALALVCLEWAVYNSKVRL